MATIEILEAQNLRQADLFSPSDPYVNIEVDGRITQKTRVISNNNSPVWNERFQVQANPTSTVRFVIYDQDIATQDDKLGEVTIRLSDYANRGMVDDWKPVAAGKGMFHFRITVACAPMPQQPMAQPSANPMGMQAPPMGQYPQQPSYGQQSSGYGQPQNQSYGQPSQGYAQPSQGYVPTPQSYAQPSYSGQQSYGYTAPAQPYSQQNSQQPPTGPVNMASGANPAMQAAAAAAMNARGY
eukprot:TRINITY_DN1453_c0_g1_i2.p1 TRINITY_DN1453_c0_g1~~TRINITY_DN1453_c0_g1_i2.p1  ORF type:complete len:240 (-),score=45.14 TRINITY_DN1453_c0_g1_i2:52-771(-)